jgi:peptide/nickel transport system permease protein
MLGFIVKRIILIAVICVAIVFFVHLGMRMARNSEVREPSYDLVSDGQLAWAESERFFGDLIAGELGAIPTEGGSIPVKDILKTAYVNSMGLLLVSLLLASIVGLAFGGASALSKRIPLALPILTLTVIGVSVPSFFAAILLQQWAIRYFQETGTRLLSVAGFGWDWQHMLLPVLVLAARPLAYLTRSSFINLNRIMNEDFIRTAYAKGLRRSAVVNLHAVRNISVPVLTAIGVSLRFSLGSLPVVELIFAWPGIGLALLDAINARQTGLVVVLALAMGLTLLIVNLVLDVSFRVIDPRLRENE